MNTPNHKVASRIIIVDATEIFLGIFRSCNKPVSDASVNPSPPGNIAIAPTSVANPYMKVAVKTVTECSTSTENSFSTI